MIREHGKELMEVKTQSWRENKIDKRGVDMRVFKERDTFFWVKFDNAEEYRQVLTRLAG